MIMIVGLSFVFVRSSGNVWICASKVRVFMSLFLWSRGVNYFLS